MKSNARAVIERLRAKLELKMKQLPPALLNEGQKVFTESFKNQGWEGKRWAKRKNSKITRPILIGRTRKLINSVRTSGRSASMTKLVWGTWVPYAKIHNEGFNGTVYVKAHKRTGKAIKTKVKGSTINGKGTTRTLTLMGAKHQVKPYSYKLRMPKRQYMGVGPTLRSRLIKKAEQVFKS